MASRSYSIVVVPERSSNSFEELARGLAPLTRQSADQLAPRLERGAVTLQTDLGMVEAERLFGQLERRSIPAEIRNEEGEVVERSGPDDEPDDESPDDDSSAAEGSSASDEEPEAVLEFEPSGAPPLDAGGDEEANEPHSPVPDHLADVPEFEVSDPGGAPDSESPGPPIPSDSGAAGAGPSQSESGERGPGREEESFDPPAISEMVSEETGLQQEGEAADSPVDTGSAPPEGPGPPDDTSFEPAGMAEVLEQGMGEADPSGESSTFEDRPAHVPALAAILSALAPGAGQEYNGDSDRAWSYALRAPLILPWISSVRQALTRARAVREGDAPKPKRGSFGRAFRHVVLLWLAVAGVGLAISMVSKLAGDVAGPGPPEDPPDRSDRIERVVEAASVGMHEARLSAWKRAGRQDREPRDRYTMAKGERAVRLYRIGYNHCRAGDYGMCESIMRKVADLKSNYKSSAYRLQVWANVRRRDGTPDAPMPDVAAPLQADAGTVEEIETPRDVGTMSGEGKSDGDGGP